MTVMRVDNAGIVVEDLEVAIEFFTELGLVLEGRAPIEGPCSSPPTRSACRPDWVRSAHMSLSESEDE